MVGSFSFSTCSGLITGRIHKAIKTFSILRIPFCVGIVFFILVAEIGHASVSVHISNGQHVNLTSDLTFTIETSTSNLVHLVFDEWVTHDGGSTATAIFGFRFNLEYSIDDGPEQTTFISSLTDNHADTFGDLTPNDGYFLFNNIAVAAGQMFKVKANSYSFAKDDNFNSDAAGSFTGNIYLADHFGNQIGTLAVVPEPSSSALFVGGLLFVGALIKNRYFTQQNTAHPDSKKMLNL